jgi:hypothetical protein
MRGLAFVAEEFYKAPQDAPFFYGLITSIYKVLADAFQFDACICLDASGTTIFDGDGPKAYDHYYSFADFVVITSWNELKGRYPNATLIDLQPVGGTPLGEYDEPDGDVIYILGGDHTPESNFNLATDGTITVPHNNKGLGMYSFCAMAVVASELYERGQVCAP